MNYLDRLPITVYSELAQLVKKAGDKPLSAFTTSIKVSRPGDMNPQELKELQVLANTAGLGIQGASPAQQEQQPEHVGYMPPEKASEPAAKEPDLERSSTCPSWDQARGIMGSNMLGVKDASVVMAGQVILPSLNEGEIPFRSDTLETLSDSHVLVWLPAVSVDDMIGENGLCFSYMINQQDWGDGDLSSGWHLLQKALFYGDSGARRNLSYDDLMDSVQSNPGSFIISSIRLVIYAMLGFSNLRGIKLHNDEWAFCRDKHTKEPNLRIACKNDYYYDGKIRTARSFSDCKHPGSIIGLVVEEGPILITD